MTKLGAQVHEFAVYVPSLDILCGKLIIEKKFSTSDKVLISRIASVLRLGVGASLILFDDVVAITAAIVAIEKKKIELRIDQIKKHQPFAPQLTIAVGLTKKKAFEEIAYFAAQLGVHALVPLITNQTKRSWGKDKECARLHAVMVAAREQSKSFTPVMLHEPQPFKTFSEQPFNGKKLYFEHGGLPFQDLVSRPKSESSLLFLGPEGGLSVDECQVLTNQGFTGYSLTPSILRTPEAVLLGAGSLMALGSRR